MVGRTIYPGVARGRVLLIKGRFSFFGGVEPETGIITDEGSGQKGVCVRDRIMVFEGGAGSTVGSYVIYGLKKSGNAPAAIINAVAEPIIATGAILSSIPMMDSVDISQFIDGEEVIVDCTRGTITRLDKG